MTVKRLPRRVGDSPRRSVVCPTHCMVWGPPHRARTPALRPPTLARGQMSRCSDGSVATAAGARRGDGQTVPVPRGRLASSIGCVSHHRMVWGPPHRARTPALRPPTRARGQMSRCSDGSVPAAAGARRGDGQTAPASRGRLAASIGCVSHHRMVWGPPHRARTPALRPPTLARGQMSRCSDGSVATAAGARRGDGQTVPVPRGRLASSIGCVSHHRMVWGPPHRARTPALRPPTLARGQMSRCSDGSVATAAGARRGDGQTVPAPRGRLAASIGCVSHPRMVWGPPHRARTPALRPPTLARGQMSRCSDGSVATAAGARRGDGQTVPVPRGRLASSIGCVSHHRMVWGPPHRARTPALRPPTLARGQMSRCSDGSVAAAAGARRGDGQTAPASRGRLAASIGCVSHHRMVWGPPHRARTPALRPPTRARVSNVAVLGRVGRCCWSPPR